MAVAPHDASAPLLASPGRGSRFDFYASCVAAIVASIVGAMIWADVSFLDLGRHETERNGRTVATISASRNVVRTKSGALPLWNVASPQDALQANDYVFTDRDSSAKLLFVDHDEIELGQNTMIQVQRFENETSLGLLKGTLRAESKGGEKPLVIRLGEKGAVLRANAGSKLNVRADADGKTAVTVLSGQAEMTHDQKSFVLETAQSATQTNDGVMEKAATLAAVLDLPAHGAHLILGDDEELLFSWSRSGRETVWFELARDDAFTQLVTSESVETDQIALKNVLPGSYFWRVRTEGLSEERRLTVARRTPPVLLWPDDGSILAQDAASFMLLWKGDGTRHDVQLSATDDFTTLIYSGGSVSHSLATPVLTGGTYFWRVKDATDPKGIWSAPARFTIGVPVADPLASPTEEEGETVLPPPDLNDQYEIEVPGANDGASLWEFLLGVDTAFASEGHAPVIRWPAVKDASAYAIQVSENENFTTILRDQDVLSPLFPFEGFRPGTYYLRIATRNSKGVKGAYTKPVKVVISIPSPRLVAPPQDATFTADRAIAFDWRRVEGSTGYRLEIARDAAFKNIVRTEHPALSALDVRGVEAGTFFWRVSAVFKDGQTSKPSATARFTVSAPPVEVAAVPAPAQLPEPEPSEVPVAVAAPVSPVAAAPISEVTASALSKPSRWSLSGGLAPTQFSYDGGNQQPDMGIRATLFNSFYAKARLTVRPGWDATAFARRLATELFTSDADAASGQPSVKIAPVTASVAVMARPWAPEALSWVAVRSGLSRRTLLSFSQEPLTPVTVTQNDLWEPMLGLAGELFVSTRWRMVGLLDYAVVMKNARANVASGTHLNADVSLVQHFADSSTFAQYGYRWVQTRTDLTAVARHGHISQNEGSFLLGLGLHL